MKMSAVVLVGAFGAVAAAMVLASPLETDTGATPAKAPNRAEAYMLATCGEVAPIAVSQAQDWHSALASRRLQDRELVLAKGTTDPAGDCAVIKG
jgi:DNA-binding transcriptional regulator YdaS (Cro superfamily)